MRKQKWENNILSTTFVFSLASIWFPTINLCLKGVVRNYVYSCKSLQNITWSFLYFLLQHFDVFFEIFTGNDHFDIFKKIFQAKTNQNRTKKLKDCSVSMNSKLFGSLQLLVIPDYPWEPLMPYISFILRTIYTCVIWMKVFFVKKRNGFCLEIPLFLWFPSSFCSEFSFSLSEETEFFLFSLGSLFCYLYFLGCFLEFLPVTIDSA